MSSVNANGLELDVTIFWSKGGERSALTQKNLPLSGEVRVGEDTACHFTIPGLASHVLVSTVAGVTTITPPSGAVVFVDRLPVATSSIELAAGKTADVTIGDFVVALSISAAETKPARDLGKAIRRSALGTILGSALVHASVFASLAFFMPSLSEASMEDVNRDQLDAMKHYLSSAALNEQDAKPVEQNSDGPGAQTAPSTKDPGGTTGTDAPKDQGKWAAQGTATPQDAKLARDHALAEASDFGMLKILGTTDPKAPVVPWGTVMLGADKESRLGNLWGGDISDSFGTTIALSDGPTCTGPNCSHGVDLEDVGNLTARTVSHCSGDHCDASGVDHGGPQMRTHETKSPNVRPDPNFSTNGHLDAEIIRRTVRQNEGKMVSCYADGLRKNPGLEGRVEVKFVIGRDGSVTMAQDGAGSDLPDQAVRACVVRSISTLSFSEPKDGTVKVTYPFTFSPQ